MDSPCDPDFDEDDVALRLAGHVGDNEGAHFWGFEFNEVQPENFDRLKNPNGSAVHSQLQPAEWATCSSRSRFRAAAMSRSRSRSSRSPASSSDGDAIFTLATPVDACPDPPIRTSRASRCWRTNNFNDVEAPRWNIPVCDPTADNRCQPRAAPPTAPRTRRISSRRADFAEASIDLTAFDIEPCFTNVIFTSRSSHPLEGADIQDVVGGDFALCGSKSGHEVPRPQRQWCSQRQVMKASPGWVINLYSDADGDEVLDANENRPIDRH